LELAIKRFEEAIAAKPHELDPLMRACDEARAATARHRKEVEDLDRQRRQLEAEISREQYNLQKAQRKLLEVKTNKEYAAMLSEIEACKRKISEYEDTVLQSMELTELHRQQWQELDRQTAEEERKLAEGRRQNEAELAVLQKVLAERRQQCEEAMSQLDHAVRDLFLRLLDLRRGLAVVGIKDGACQGCFVTLPPQLIQDVRRNDRIITCSYCHRILYWNAEAHASASASEASELVR
jgi:predicted  nucleic acid-binding Zn-ribbon protein